MSKLRPRIKRISLDFLGDGWEESYLELRAVKWAEVRDFDPEKMANAEAVDRMLALLADNFVAGQGIDPDGQPVRLAVEDLDEFDLETQTTIFQRFTGTGDPNA